MSIFAHAKAIPFAASGGYGRGRAPLNPTDGPSGRVRERNSFAKRKGDAPPKGYFCGIENRRRSRK